MVLTQCSTDRWQAHCEIHREFGKEAERGYLWRFVGDGEAIVRPSCSDIIVPPEGSRVTFRIDCAIVRRQRGQRMPLLITEQLACDWFADRIAESIEIQNVAARPMIFTILKHEQAPFTRPYARIVGTGKVLSRDKLEQIMRQGLGEAKAYGFGLLEIERIET